MNVIIHSETNDDRTAIWNVNQAAFAGDLEANLVNALRDGGYATLSLVAELDGQIVGHLLFSRVTITTRERSIESLSLAPMAVLPSHQRQGIGSKLVEAGLTRCRDSGHQSVLVLGHPEYYPRFGFSADRARQLASPFGGGDAWMTLELMPGTLAGVEGQVEFSLPFMAFA